MSRFSKLSHVIWHCQYHIVWVPKYRYRVLNGKVGFEVIWAKGYCVDTVGVDAEMIRKYVKYQERRERTLELDLT